MPASLSWLELKREYSVWNFRSEPRAQAFSTGFPTLVGLAADGRQCSRSEGIEDALVSVSERQSTQDREILQKLDELSLTRTAREIPEAMKRERDGDQIGAENHGDPFHSNARHEQDRSHDFKDRCDREEQRFSRNSLCRHELERCVVIQDFADSREEKNEPQGQSAQCQCALHALFMIQLTGQRSCPGETRNGERGGSVGGALRSENIDRPDATLRTAPLRSSARVRPR
jgi:hypothetical protein